MLGSSGRKSYTLSVLNILNNGGLTSSEYAFHQSCDQYKYQNRGYTGKNKHSGRTHQNVNRQGDNNRGGYSPSNIQNAANSENFSVPTKNRFDQLSRKDPKNW